MTDLNEKIKSENYEFESISFIENIKTEENIIEIETKEEVVIKNKCFQFPEVYKIDPETDHNKKRNEKNARSKPIKCQTCNVEFSTQHNCDDHYKTIHLKIRPFKCVLCKKGFTRESHLIKHERTHTGEKPFSCETCDKTYARKEHLNNHKKRFHSKLFMIDNPQIITCDICHEVFISSNGLSQHRLAHQNTMCVPKLNNKCIICDKEFPSPSHLVRHERTHTGQKPFFCEICDKTFTRNENLNNHKKKFHSKLVMIGNPVL